MSLMCPPNREQHPMRYKKQIPDSPKCVGSSRPAWRSAVRFAISFVFVGMMLSGGIAFGQTESRTEEFLFELAGQPGQQISKVVIYNEGEGGQNLYSKDFLVLVATEGDNAKSFQEIVSGSLEPWTGPQTFEFEPLPARFVKLIILSGYTPEFRELAEVEVYSANGENVAAAGNGGKLLLYSSAYTEDRNSEEGDCSASNIIDSVLSGAGSSWRSQGHRYVPYPPSEFLFELSDQATQQIGKVVFYNEGHGGPSVQDLHLRRRHRRLCRLCIGIRAIAIRRVCHRFPP